MTSPPAESFKIKQGDFSGCEEERVPRSEFSRGKGKKKDRPSSIPAGKGLRLMENDGNDVAFSAKKLGEGGEELAKSRAFKEVP